jgi:endoglucanase
MQMQRMTMAIVLVAVTGVASVPCARGAQPADGDWWKARDAGIFDSSTLASNLPRIRVEGNAFVEAAGERLVLRGVNISDPDKLEAEGHWSREYFEAIREWGADVVRVPVHPVAWRERGADGIFGLLDEAVRWASDLGLYLIIDWHSIGNLRTGLFQRPMYDTSVQETYGFWRAVAERYGQVSTVAFYEIFNEPTTFSGKLGGMSWASWKAINEEVIGIIRANGAGGIPLVAGLDWAYELRSVRDDPVEAAGIGYVSHPYPMKAEQPWEEHWERDFGHVAASYPLFATELGFMPAGEAGAHVPVIADEDYGARIVAYFERKGISWAAWCFDPDWPPQLIADWRYTPTREGAFFRAVMSRSQPSP